MLRFSNLRDRVVEVVHNLLNKYKLPTKDMITNLISIELAFINTNHPDFVGGDGAISEILERMSRANQANNPNNPNNINNNNNSNNPNDMLLQQQQREQQLRKQQQQQQNPQQQQQQGANQAGQQQDGMYCYLNLYCFYYYIIL